MANTIPAGPVQWDPLEGTSSLGRLGLGFQQSVHNIPRALGQWSHRLGLGGYSPEDIDEFRRIDAPLLNTPEGRHGAMLGNVAQGLATVPLTGGLSAMPIAAGMLGRVAGPMAAREAAPIFQALKSSVAAGGKQGALNSALTPTGTGESPAVNMGLGTVAGGVFGGAGNLMRRGLSALPVSEWTAKAREWGPDIKKMVGDALPSWTLSNDPLSKTASSVLGSLPGATSAKELSQAVKEKYSRAISNLWGSDNPDMNAAWQEGWGRVKQGFTDLYNRNPMNPVNLNLKEAIKNANAAEQLAKQNPSNSALQSANEQIKTNMANLQNYQQSGATMTGDEYQTFRSDMGNQAQDSAQKSLHPTITKAFKSMKQAADDAWTKSVVKSGNPDDANEMATLRKQYQALQTVNEDGVKPIYDKTTGLVPFNALANKMDKKPNVWPGLRSESEPVTGDRQMTLARLGISDPFQKLQAAETAAKSSGHGAAAILGGLGSTGLAAGAGYALGEHMGGENKDDRAMELALAFGTAAPALGYSLGRYATGPGSTMGPFRGLPPLNRLSDVAGRTFGALGERIMPGAAPGIMAGYKSPGSTPPDATPPNVLAPSKAGKTYTDDDLQDPWSSGQNAQK